MPSMDQNKMFHKDMSQSSISSILSVRIVLIVLNVMTKIDFEELSCMNFFLSDVREKGIKVMIILTHVDKLNHLKENDKLTLIEERINMLRGELDFKDRDDFVCV